MKKYDHTYIEVSKDDKWMRVSVNAKQYWLLTSDSEDERLKRKYGQRYPDSSQVDIINCLANDYPKGATAWYCGLMRRIWRKFVEKIGIIESYITIALCKRSRKPLPGHRMIRCVHCGKKLSVPNKYPSIEIECPACKKVFKAVRKYV